MEEGSKFFDFIGLKEGAKQERQDFTESSKKEPDWAFVTILRFVQSQKERVENGGISPATLRNYIKAVKVFTSFRIRQRMLAENGSLCAADWSVPPKVLLVDLALSTAALSIS